MWGRYGGPGLIAEAELDEAEQRKDDEAGYGEVEKCLPGLALLLVLVLQVLDRHPANHKGEHLRRRDGEMWGDVGRDGEVGSLYSAPRPRDMGRYGEMGSSIHKKFPGRCRDRSAHLPIQKASDHEERGGEMSGELGRCRDIWRDMGRYGEIWGSRQPTTQSGDAIGRCGEIWGGMRRYGGLSSPPQRARRCRPTPASLAARARPPTC